MTRWLITGGTGFIGHHLVQHLATETADDIFLLVREAYSLGTPLPPPLSAHRERFSLVYADLRNFNLTLRAVREASADCVIHLAAVGATDPFLDVHTAVRHNLTGTLNLLRACFEKSFGCQRFITARTPGELTAMNAYAASKAAAWNFCQMYARTQGWPLIGAMVFQCYGHNQAERALVPAAVRAALSGATFPMTAGTQQRDWIHVSDVVLGLHAMGKATMLEAGESYDLGTGINTSVADVVRQIYALAAEMRGGHLTGAPLIGALPDRPGEVTSQRADIARTAAALGWLAAVPLDAGLRAVIGAIIEELEL